MTVTGFESPAQLVKRVLAVMGITQEQLGPLLHRSQQAISQLVQGRTKDPLVIDRLHWLMAKEDALTVCRIDPKTIKWCKPSYTMDPPAFLEHLPTCGDCQAAVVKSAGYVG